MMMLVNVRNVIILALDALERVKMTVAIVLKEEIQLMDYVFAMKIMAGSIILKLIAVILYQIHQVSLILILSYLKDVKEMLVLDQV
eukprot:CAMPEP_0168317056 /NCGR_PEP_ID=MMETSP0210-20121227/22113_1 /TAXON_ID=40633 /ORGANISM="Condylostoma magnum, Strain COL2" /LENGTH=85 /DNA_ID=CAMNT_0008310339 /DNA_START=7222 /DNA_END=7479 /DNA_ORIENTATION=+